MADETGARMKLGLNLVRTSPERMPALAAHAESLGYESVFVPDHVVMPVSFASAYPGTADGDFPYPRDTPLHDPWIVLTAIGRSTSTIRLGTAVYLLALRHPMVTARLAVSLEHLVGPRLVLGVGAGWLTEEFESLGLDPRTRFSRIEEAAAAVRRLWTEREPSFEGRHFAFPPCHFEPKPRTQPNPPIIFGGDSEGAMRRAVRFGDGWMSGGVSAGVEALDGLVRRLASVRAVHETAMPTSGRPFEITILHPRPQAAELARMAELGVHRVVVMPWRRNRDAPEAIERFMGEAEVVVSVEAAG